LADRVLLKIIYLLIRRLFSLAVLMLRCDSAKDAELLALRHENAVLRRHTGTLRPGRPGVVRRAGPALAPRPLDGGFPRDPSDAADLAPQAGPGKYDTSNLRKPGRPPTVPSIARIIVRLGNENPLYVKPGIMWSRRAMPPSGRGVCESGCQQDRRM